MTFLGFLITLAVGMAVGYWFASVAAGNRAGARNGQNGNGQNRQGRNNNIAQQRGAFGTEVGTMGEANDPYQSHGKTAASSAAVFVNEQRENRHRARQQYMAEMGTMDEQTPISTSQAKLDQQTVTNETTTHGQTGGTQATNRVGGTKEATNRNSSQNRK